MARVVVVGASGNVGSAAVRSLLADGHELVGVVRRIPSRRGQVAWQQCDIGESDAGARLVDLFRDADAVVHLAWEIQPGRNVDQQYRTNVVGSGHVVEAVVAAKVPTLVYMSSVGTYSPGPKDRAVDESWPTQGIPTSTYARHKAEVERLLDRLDARSTGLRLVRFRPGLVFQRDAASEIARYFLGPFVPLTAIRRRFIPVVPVFDRLAFQAVHADDVGHAIALAVADPSAHGAFNLAADPVLDAERLAQALHATRIPVPLTLVRAAADAAFRARLIPTDAGWVDMAAAVPVMSSERARRELGWSPTSSSEAALLELIEGMHDGAGAASPTLFPAPSVPGRLVEAARAFAAGGPGRRNP